MASIKETFTVKQRNLFGKGAGRRLREKGNIPGIFYSAKGDNIPFEVPAMPLKKHFEKVGRTGLFTLVIENNGKSTSHTCLVWDIDYHPTKSCIDHIDFYGVDLDSELKVHVPVILTGTAKGTKLGGVLEFYRETILLSSKPMELPPHITIDVTEFQVGQGIRISELPLPQGVTAVFDLDFTIVGVVSPKAGSSIDDELAELDEAAAAESAEGAEGEETPAAEAQE